MLDKPNQVLPAIWNYLKVNNKARTATVPFNQGIQSPRLIAEPPVS
jgi:hypothetical protein